MLTPSGEAKLQAIYAITWLTLRTSLQRELEAARAMAASLAPGPDEEAALLSRGVAQDGRYAGQTIGVPDFGRFLKDGPPSEETLQGAIGTDPIDDATEGDLVLYGTGSASRINRRSGFSWITRGRRAGVRFVGIEQRRGPTFPFNYQLVEAMENGGMFWRVVPRNTPGGLSPEPGKSTFEMIKTLPPVGMFRTARAQMRTTAVANVRADLKTALQVLR